MYEIKNKNMKRSLAWRSYKIHHYGGMLHNTMFSVLWSEVRRPTLSRPQTPHPRDESGKVRSTLRQGMALASARRRNDPDSPQCSPNASWSAHDTWDLQRTPLRSRTPQQVRHVMGQQTGMGSLHRSVRQPQGIPTIRIDDSNAASPHMPRSALELPHVGDLEMMVVRCISEMLSPS